MTLLMTGEMRCDLKAPGITLLSNTCLEAITCQATIVLENKRFVVTEVVTKDGKSLIQMHRFEKEVVVIGKRK